MESEEKCIVCNGSQIIREQGKNKVCPCFYLALIKTKINKIFGKVKLEKQYIEVAKEAIPHSNIHIHTESKDIFSVNGMLSSLWAELGLQPSVEYLNAYKLVDIYLGKEESYSTVLHLNSDILIIVWGQREFLNKRLEELILQTLEHRYQKRNWFVTMDSVSRIPAVKSYLELKDYHFISLDSGGSSIFGD